MKHSEIRKLISEAVAEVISEAKSDEEKPYYTPEQKRQFKDKIRKFNGYSDTIARSDIVAVYKDIKSIVEFAENHIADASGEWFDDVTTTRHIKRLKESMKVFEKTASESIKLQQRLESAYEDIGETLSKYYIIVSSNDNNYDFTI